MKLLFAATDGSITWKITPNDHSILYIDSVGLTIVNPILYKEIIDNDDKNKLNPISINFKQPHLLSTEDFSIITTNFIVFIVDEQKSKYVEHFDKLSLCLECLRKTTKQVSMARKIVFTQVFDVEKLPEFRFQEEKINMFAVMEYVLSTALTCDQLNIDLNIINESIYDSILLDSIEAFQKDDYMKALLYAAMSIEIAFSQIYESNYIDVINSDKISTNFRLMKKNKGKNEIVQYDPIYETLKRKNNFKYLLHEIPLYILGKSLYTSNKDLYDYAIAIYKTRNSIVHSGKIPKDAIVKMDRHSVIKAISCAISIFNWLGINTNYKFDTYFNLLSFNDDKDV